MKRGDLVLIHHRGDGDLDGRTALVLDFMDENLRSGRMHYAKVLLPDFSIRFLSPDSLEVLSETR